MLNAPARYGLLALVLASTVGVCEGQTLWTQLLVEDSYIPFAEDLPGFDSNDRIRNNAIRDIQLAPNGSYGVVVNTDKTQGNTSSVGSFYIAGSTDRGESIRALRREATLGGIEQTTFGTLSFDNEGTQLYTSRLGSAGNPTGLWQNDTLVLQEDNLIPAGPLAGKFVDNVSRPEQFNDGVVSLLISYADTSGGARSGTTLFKDLDSFDIALQSGASIGAGLTAEPELLGGNLDWSLLGTNYLTNIKVAPTPGINNPNNDIDEAIVLNGQVLADLGGSVLHEGQPISPAAGGLPNQTWSFGSLYAVNEAGDWAISASARINGTGNTTEDFIVYNGEIVYRDGQTVDGHTLSGLPSSLSLNDRGDLAFVWDNKAFVNDEIVAEVGDQVDGDGDGVGDTVNISGTDFDITLINVFNLELTNLPSGRGDGLPLVYVEARAFLGLETLLTNRVSRIEGDYNGDGVVDAVDYTVWRDTLGSESLLAADGDEDNVIGPGDLTVWANAYGSVAPGSSTTVPEPVGLALFGTALLAIAAHRPTASRA